MAAITRKNKNKKEDETEAAADDKSKPPAKKKKEIVVADAGAVGRYPWYYCRNSRGGIKRRRGRNNSPPQPEAGDISSKAGADSESVDTPTISNKDEAPGFVSQTPKHNEEEGEVKGEVKNEEEEVEEENPLLK